MTSKGLRAIRTQAGMSRAQLSRLADVSSGLIQIIEAGYQCSPESAEKIAAALGVAPGDLWAPLPERRPDDLRVIRRQRLDASRDRLVIEAGGTEATCLLTFDADGTCTDLLIERQRPVLPESS